MYNKKCCTTAIYDNSFPTVYNTICFMRIYKFCVKYWLYVTKSDLEVVCFCQDLTRLFNHHKSDVYVKAKALWERDACTQERNQWMGSQLTTERFHNCLSAQCYWVVWCSNIAAATLQLSTFFVKFSIWTFFFNRLTSKYGVGHQNMREWAFFTN